MKRRPLLVLLLALAACPDRAAPPDSAVPTDLGLAPDLATPDLRWVWPDLRFTSFDAGTPPLVKCGGDAAARDGAVECPPPESQCAAADSTWLIYFTNGRCVRGQCAWDRMFLDCADDDGKRCLNGGCEYQLTM